MTAREYLNTKMYWTQDDVPIKTVTPEDIIDWLNGYAQMVKNNAVLNHIKKDKYTVCILCGDPFDKSKSISNEDCCDACYDI